MINWHLNYIKSVKKIKHFIINKYPVVLFTSPGYNFDKYMK